MVNWNNIYLSKRKPLNWTTYFSWKHKKCKLSKYFKKYLKCVFLIKCCLKLDLMLFLLWDIISKTPDTCILKYAKMWKRNSAFCILSLALPNYHLKIKSVYLADCAPDKSQAISLFLWRMASHFSLVLFWQWVDTLRVT